MRRTFARWMLSFALLTGTSLGMGSPGWEPAAACAQEKQANLPVKRVVMFSSGVAFYERQGKVEGNAALDLKFNVRDVNDLLKSMVLQDLGGGKISTISYASKNPVHKALQSFAIDLTSNPSLADLLSQVRGEQVEVHAPEKITGTILGLEKRTLPAGKSETIEVTYLNLLTTEGLRSVALDGVGKIKLTNAKLDAELKQALTVLAGSKSADKKAVTLNFLGAGERQVKVGYVQESPIWKTSYRLVLEDEKPPLLQGWAIVENTTEDDWDGVQLSLVSGRPVSFQMDLYQPLYVDRPVIQLELFASLRPKTYDQDLASAEREFMDAAAPRAAAGLAKKSEELARSLGSERAKDKAGGLTGGFGRADAAAEFLEQAGQGENKRFRPGESVQSVAQATDVGEMFQYTIATPVKLVRQQSAMLPIVNDSVSGEKVSIYNPSVHAKHPLNGLRLKNTTDLHLMQGPITVFDDGTYAGDAKIQDLPPKSERLISYAMDLDTEVAPASGSSPSQLVAVKLIRGTMHIQRKHTREQNYTIKNSGKAAKKVLIEYPIDTTWALVEPKEPAEKTRDQYRFAVTAEPGKPANLKVQESYTSNEQVAATNLDDGTIAFYINAKEVSPKIKEALGEIVKRKQALALVHARLIELNRQIDVIFAEQGRVRQNMAQVPKDSELFRKYLAKFGEQEDQVEKLRADVQKVIAEQAAAQQKLNDYLYSLDLT